MATLLEKVDNPANALAACRLCLEELHSMPAVQKSFSVQLKKGFKSWFHKAEREEIISSICCVNRAIYDVTQMVGDDVNLLLWPCVDNGEERVDPLRDSRVIETMRTLDMERWCVAPWSFGQQDEEKHGVKTSCCIGTNTQGQFITLDGEDIKVFDSSGNYLYSSDSCPKAFVYWPIIATDRDDNVYLLCGRWECTLFVFDKDLTLDNHFNLPFDAREPLSLTMNDYNKALLVGRSDRIEMYKTNGQCLRSLTGFGYGQLGSTQDIIAVNDGRILVLVSKVNGPYLYVFSAQGDQLSNYKAKEHEGCYARQIEFQRNSELVVILHTTPCRITDEWPSALAIYTTDCTYVRSIHLLHKESMIIPVHLRGITVTQTGRIALCVLDVSDGEMKKHKVLVI